MGANSPQHAWQRKPLHDQLNGLLVFSMSDKLDITLNIDTRRTGDNTGRPILFIDTECDGNRLRKRSINGLSLTKPLVPFTGHGNRTYANTFTTAGAKVFFHIARFTSDFDRIIADVPRYLSHFAV